MLNQGAMSRREPQGMKLTAIPLEQSVDVQLFGLCLICEGVSHTATLLLKLSHYLLCGYTAVSTRAFRNFYTL